jgi:hypothetical protein
MNPAEERTDPPQKPGFVVVERKESGREVTVSGPCDEATAASVAKLFRWAGAIVRVERAL